LSTEEGPIYLNLIINIKYVSKEKKIRKFKKKKKKEQKKKKKKKFKKKKKNIMYLSNKFKIA